MSRKRSTRLVIDADIARAAGESLSRDVRSTSCRGFLELVRKISYRLVLSQSLRTEWVKHSSAFTRIWLVKMTSLRKVDQIEVAEMRAVRERIEELAMDAGIRRAMLKDVHLIEAALSADRVVISLDETVRGHFKQAAPSIDEIEGVVWVNPVNATERATEWLADGAPPDRPRQLGYRRR